MENIINITDKLVIKKLEYKISRLQNQIEKHLIDITECKMDSFNLVIQIDILKQENNELKKLLKALNVDIIYDR